MTAITIPSNQLASAIFGGFADIDFKKPFVDLFNNIVIGAKAIAGAIKRRAMGAADAIKRGWAFFQGWMKSDPIAATAGAGAVLLSAGLLLVSGGAIVGAVAGSITALRAISLVSVAGRLFTAAGFLGILGPLIRLCVRGTQFLWNFNWNVTDKQLKEQQKALLGTLYGQAGATLGSALGSLLCGTAPIELLKRSNLVRVNPLVLAKIKEISEFDPQSDQYGDIYEEMMDNAKALVAAGTRVASQHIFIECFKNFRKFIKVASRATGLEKIFPGLAKMIAKWGEEGSTPWSFAKAQEDFVESIEDQNLQNFTEEFLESFQESCTESLMVISYV